MPPLYATRGFTYRVKFTVDQCVFGRDYKKSTNIWSDDGSWCPSGITGDGRCHQRCGKGEYVNGYYRHFKALAMKPVRSPRGKGHTKEKNALPPQLLEEVLLSSLHKHKGHKGQRVIIDLCSGFQSWAPVAEKYGCVYVAIDVLGDRNK